MTTSALVTLDLDDLERVTGGNGQSTSVTAEADLKKQTAKLGYTGSESATSQCLNMTKAACDAKEGNTWSNTLNPWGDPTAGKKAGACFLNERGTCKGF